MRECRSSGSVEGVRGNHDSYSDSVQEVARVNVLVDELATLFKLVGNPASLHAEDPVDLVRQLSEYLTRLKSVLGSCDPPDPPTPILSVLAAPSLSYLISETDEDLLRRVLELVRQAISLKAQPGHRLKIHRLFLDTNDLVERAIGVADRLGKET
jgi:hypothetical protein